MYCKDMSFTLSPITGSSTFSASMSSIPSSAPSLSTTPLSPVTKDVMCSSLGSIPTIINEADQLSGDCEINEKCITLLCNLTVDVGLTLDLHLNITLHPCEDPYAVSIVLSIFDGGDLINGKYTNNETVSQSGIRKTDIMVIQRYSYGVDIAVSIYVHASCIHISRFTYSSCIYRGNCKMLYIYIYIHSCLYVQYNKSVYIYVYNI